MGSLLAIARHQKSRAPIELLPRAEIGGQFGVSGDFRGTSSDRQIVVVSEEGWRDACRDLGKQAPWTTRRGNLLVSGVELYNSARSHLQVGEVILQVMEECAPCHVMDEQVPGLRAALRPRWRAGVSCKVIRGGFVQIGDPVTLTSAALSAE